MAAPQIFSTSQCYKIPLSDSAGTGAANSALIEAAQDAQGYGTGERIRKPLYIQAGTYPTDSIVLGTNAAGDAARAGLTIGTGGGCGVGLNRNHNTVGSGNITRLYFKGTQTGTEKHITYHGAGLHLGPIELSGIDLTSGTDYTNRDTDADYPKTYAGIYITSLGTSGVPNGRINASHVLLQGYKKGIYVYQSDSSGNNDNLTWGTLDFDACDVGYEVNSSQSVTHLIDKVHTNYYVDTIFKFIKGGDLHVGSVQMNNPNCTLLDLSGMTYHNNYGNFEIRNVKIDNNATSPVLLKLATYVDTPRNVIITGSISSASYTTADLVQNAHASDRIFIRFTGPSAAVSDFNGKSTVSEPPF